MKKLAHKIVAFSALIASASIASAGVIPWSGLDATAHVSTNWSDFKNWVGSAVPGTADTAYFDNAGLSTSAGSKLPGNIVDADITVDSLWYSPTNTAPKWQNTVINAGVTLSVTSTNAEIVFDSGTQTDPPAGTTQSYSTINGAGSLVVNDTNSESVMIVSQGSSTYTGVAGLWASLDMSNLMSFNGTFGRLLVGVQGVGATSNEVTLVNSGRQTGRLSLAQTNIIHLTQTGNTQGGANAAASGPAFVVLDSGFFGDFGSTVSLGRSNAIWADTITIGRNGALQSGVLQFNPLFTGAEQLYLRGESSNRVSEMIVADGTFNTSSSMYEAPDSRITVTPQITGGLHVGESAIVDVSAGTSDIMADLMVLGKGLNAAGGGYAVGQFNMGAGTLDVNTLQLGVISAANAVGVPVTGVLNVHGGAVIANTELDLGVPQSQSTVQAAGGVVNITGGGVWANTINIGGGSNNAISIKGGSLVVTNPLTGPAFAMTLDSSTANGQASVTMDFANPVALTTLTVDGNAADQIVINVSSLPAVIAFPASFTLFSATTVKATGGTLNLAVGALPPGYNGGSIVKNGTSITLNVASGPGTGSVWTGTDAIGIQNFNWSDTNNWLDGITPTAVSTTIFNNGDLSGSQGPGVQDNVIDADFTTASLWYAETNTAPMWHNTVINAGVTLTISNDSPAIVLDAGTQTDPTPGNTQNYNTISGSGSLIVNDTNSESVVIVSQGSSTYTGDPGLWASLDMSNLDNFIGTFGRLLVGVQGVGPTPGEVSLINAGRQSGIMSLAATNSIHLTQTGNVQGAGSAAAAGPALVINDTPYFGDFRSALTLGQSNAIWADSITVGRQQCSRSAFLEFNAGFSPSQLFLRGESSNRVAEFIVGDNTVNGGNCNASPNGTTQGFDPVSGDQDFIAVPSGGIQVGSAGVVDLSGGSSDIMIDTLILGKSFEGGGGGYAAGVFNLGTGTMNVNSLLMGVMSSNTSTLPAFGALNVDGGAVFINGVLALGQGYGGATTQLGYGALNINGGGVWANSLTDSESSSNSININGGSLVVSNAIGTAATLASLSINSSTAQSSLTLNINSGPLNVVSLTADGGSVNNVISINALPQVFLLPATLPVIQAASTINLNGGAFNVVLGTLPNGYAGHLVNGGSAIELVLTSAPVSANAWSAGDPSDRTNWSDALNWNGGVPTSSGAAVFNATASKPLSALSTIGGGVAALIPANINNVVDTSFSVAGLIYTNLASYENTYIPSGNSLTVGTLASFGIASADLGKSASGHVTISGPGAFDVENGFFAGLGDTNSGNASEATLDMSALNTFNANVNTFLVGVGGYASGYNVPENAGVVYLAQTNIITATSGTPDGNDSTPVALEVGDADSFVNGTLSPTALQGTVGSALYLGASTVVNANFISVGRQLATGGIWFNPAITNANPTTNSGPVAWFQGNSGPGSIVNNWTIGDGVANPLSTGLGGSGASDFTGGWVNAQVGTLTVANSSSGSQTVGAVNGSLTLAAGVINAGALNVSFNNAYADGIIYSYGAGSVNVEGTGSITVNGAINLSWTGGPRAAGAAPVGALNINGAGASVTANSLIAGANGGVSIVTVSGGSLTASNGLGSVSAPLTTLNLTNATIGEGALIAPFVNAQNVNVGGTTITFDVLAVPPIEVYPISFTLVQSATTINGSASYSVVLPENFAGTAKLGADSKSIVMTLTSGPVVPRGNVFWIGPDNGNMNWSDAANWFLPPVPAPVDTAFFDNIGESSTPGAGSADNTVDANITVGGLWYAQTNSNATDGWHNTVINAGVTLTVSSAAASIILDTGTQTDPQLAVGPGSATCYSTISGDGTMIVNDTNAESFFVVSQGSSTYAGGLGGDNLFASMDMSGLSAFNGTFGRLLLGIEGAAPVPGVPTLVGSSRQTGRLALAATNVIHLAQTGNIQGTGAASVSGAALVICDQGGTGGGFGDFASYLFLGQSNALWADTITVGREGTVHTAVLEFNPAPPWTGPQQFFLRGESSNRVSEIIVADNTLSGTTGNSAGNGGLPSPGVSGPPEFTVVPPPGGNTAANPAGINVGSAAVFDVSGGISDMMVDTLIVGKSYQGAGGGYADGVFNLGPGTLNVNTLTLAQMSSAAANVPCAGLLNVMDPAGVVIVNDELALGQAFGGGTSQYIFAGITNSGTLEAASITSGGDSYIALTTIGTPSATLSLTSAAGSIGTVAAPIGSITLSGGTVLNLSVGGSVPAVVTSNVTTSGTTDTINITSLPSFASVPATNVLIQSLTPISGNDFVLGTLPNGYAGHIQPSADNTSIILVVTASAPPAATPPTITQASIVSGELVLSGTNGTPNQTYYLLGSTNLALPPDIRWSIVSTNAFDANGDFNLSLPVSKGTEGEFYAIKPQ